MTVKDLYNHTQPHTKIQLYVTIDDIDSSVELQRDEVLMVEAFGSYIVNYFDINAENNGIVAYIATETKAKRKSPEC